MKEWILSVQVSKTQGRIQQKGVEAAGEHMAGWLNPCQTDWDRQQREPEQMRDLSGRRSLADINSMKEAL